MNATILGIVIGWAILVAMVLWDHDHRLESHRDALCAAWRAGEITLAPKDCPKATPQEQERDIAHRIATAVAKAKEAR